MDQNNIEKIKLLEEENELLKKYKNEFQKKKF